MIGPSPETPLYIALVGQPNTGKTSLFNHLTGLNFKTVNYPGSTVEYIEGKWRRNPAVQIMDTPGIRSLYPGGLDEEVTINLLKDLTHVHPKAPRHPQLVVVTMNAEHLLRHLIIADLLHQAGFRVIGCITMADSAEKKQTYIDKDALSRQLDIPICQVNGRNGKGISELNQLIQTELIRLKPVRIQQALFEKPTPEQIMRRFERAESLVKDVVAKGPEGDSGSDIDHWVLHPFWGGVMFVGIMTLFFWSIFSLASPLMDGVDGLMSMLISAINTLGAGSIASRFVSEGIVGGVGAVLVFVPQIAILFFGLGLLESSGYLARGAVIVDRPLSMVGLNGRSFVPLLSGCACAIPAMLAARAIPHKKERLLTLFVIPLMSCSARLPVYGLLLSVLIPDSMNWAKGAALTFIYFGSIVFTSVSAAIAGRMLGLKGQGTLQIELPDWRRPNFKVIGIQSISQTMSFIQKAGPVIMGVSAVVWALSQFPSADHSWMMMIGHWMSPVFLPMGVDWRVGVGLLVSFAAREVFVSALTVVFLAPGQEAGANFMDVLRHATFEGTQVPIFTPASIVGLILFFMISMQCLATLAIARKEMGNWKLPLLQMATYIISAYVLAVLAVQGLRWIGVP